MDNIKTIREKINDIDKQIALLYEQRMLLMEDVAEYKIKNDLPVLDNEREKIVIEKNKEFIQDQSLIPLYEEFIQFIMDQGKSIQEEIIDKRTNE